MEKYMKEAFKEAYKSLLTDDVPVGAVIVENNKIIAKAHNSREKSKIVTKHAEINAIEKACKKKNTWHLDDCEIYITLEPCKMCLGAIEQARIKKIYYATDRKKELKTKIEKKQLKEYQSQAEITMKNFFKNKRK